ncbi:MAG TPA: sigma-54 dependent transcriptional regulator [Patescibacteria group bacterium]|nr:sigma-54 dependent transcriptional regulator [Patescibacteria group bacterium]
MTRKASILVLDADPAFVRQVEETLTTAGHQMTVVEQESDALAKVRGQAFDMAIVDLERTGTGAAFLEEMKRSSVETPVAITGARLTVETVVAAMRRGAWDVLRKPVTGEDVLRLAERAARIKELGKERSRAAEDLQSERARNAELRRSLQGQHAFTAVLGRSPKMKQILDLLREVCATDSTVLLMGESGTGKGLLARILHYNSHRATGPFVEANCAVYSEGVLNSELFGHEKGAFTGALKQKKGRFELADHGTVFLDEIGDLTPATQLMLLRFLQERRFERVGGEETLHVDVRVIAATNKNLQEGMERGSFRNDLFYRLNVIPLHIPPLRERAEDIPILGTDFLERSARKAGKPARSFSEEALDILVHYAWPGNVRELENVIERSVVLAKGERIEVTDLPTSLREASGDGGDGRLSLQEHERLYILKTLAECNWNKKLAASMLGINRSSLYSKLKKHDIGRGPSAN